MESMYPDQSDTGGFYRADGLATDNSYWKLRKTHYRKELSVIIIRNNAGFGCSRNIAIYHCFDRYCSGSDYPQAPAKGCIEIGRVRQES